MSELREIADLERGAYETRIATMEKSHEEKLSKETEEFEGKEYPVYRVPVSSQSHPFFTGSQQFVDSEGRVDKFRKRYAAKSVHAKKESDQGESQEDQDKKKKEKKTAKKKSPGK